ncbi:hypothetical protein D3C87_1786530 [compost metagenome]
MLIRQLVKIGMDQRKLTFGLPPKTRELDVVAMVTAGYKVSRVDSERFELRPRQKMVEL